MKMKTNMKMSTEMGLGLRMGMRKSTSEQEELK